jgi:hypothetical protein
LIITVQTTLLKENADNQLFFKLLNQKLREKAAELQHFSLRHLEYVDPIFDDVVIYLTYSDKNQLRWHIANDVSEDITLLVTREMTKLGLQVLT